MKRKRLSYLHHKQRNLAYTRIYDADGKRRTIYLGEFDSPESHESFHQIHRYIRTAEPGALRRWRISCHNCGG